MKWIRFCSAVVASLSLTTVAQAGLFSGHGDSKCCGCASTCQPQCCKPTIKRPCCPTVHTYQRKCSTLKPPCCDTCCAPKHCCKPAPAKCCAPAPAKCAAPAPAQCAAPAPAKCCAPAPSKCCAPKSGCCAKSSCCQKSCCQTKCCNADPCEIAKLIYTSQTACYAKDRRRAIDDLGDFDCQCNPEIMTAMIYALNDADEKVRAEAADEIGDQLRKNPCCCSKCVIAALTAALGDCDKKVRRQAEEGLEACGYEVVDGCCCGVSCDPCQRGCGCAAPAGCAAPGAVPAPMPHGGDKKAAPPAPGTEKVYYPAKLRRVPNRKRGRLASLFSLLD